MIDKLYGKYFQKSRSFLYPALGIKRSSFLPLGTYMSIENQIEFDEVNLICTFKHDESVEFKNWESQMLLENPLFKKKMTTEDFNVYIFDLDTYESDFFNVILGKYSRLSTMLKKAIKLYYGEKSAEYKYIETYLYPEKFFENYADLLKVDIKTLRYTGELCDPCDLEKETLKLSNESLLIFNKIS